MQPSQNFKTFLHPSDILPPPPMLCVVPVCPGPHSSVVVTGSDCWSLVHCVGLVGIVCPINQWQYLAYNL